MKIGAREDFRGRRTGFERTAKKPDGGFCFISATAILRAWVAYHERSIRLADLRVWLACFELVARRCGLQKGGATRYRWEELHTLVGGAGGRHLSAAVRRLEGAGLLRWSLSGITFPASDAEAHGLDASAGPMRNRPVPVPRRLLRRLAAGSSRAVLATAFGHLLRCLHYRNGQCVSGGFCKASWIARTFGVHERNIKWARQRLAAEGWLIVCPVSQAVLNHGGAAVTWNMSWSVPDSESPPPLTQTASGSPPPMKKKELSTRSEQQKPPGTREDGIRAGRAMPARRPPTLRDVVVADLADAKRLAVLHHQAAQAGWVRDCEADWLNVAAAAEHARRCGMVNPPGLFVWLLRHKRWDHISQADEDAARRSLGVIGKARTQPVRDPRPKAAGAVAMGLIEQLVKREI